MGCLSQEAKQKPIGVNMTQKQNCTCQCTQGGQYVLTLADGTEVPQSYDPDNMSGLYHGSGTIEAEQPPKISAQAESAG